MRTLSLVIFLLTLRTAKQQCYNSFGGNYGSNYNYGNGNGNGNGFYSGSNDLNAFQQASQQPQPTYQQQTQTHSPSFKWRRRALNRRVKRAKRSISDENDLCPMDFLRNAVNDGMTGKPQQSMKKIFSFLTYMNREDLGVVCSLSPLHIESFSHNFCYQTNNSTRESCLIFGV